MSRSAEDPARKSQDRASGAVVGITQQDNASRALERAREPARRALQRGLEWLAREQARESDGSFPATGLATRGGIGASAASDQVFAPTALCALGALAFMAAGSPPGRGPFGRESALAVDWLVARVDLDARSTAFGYVSSAGDPHSRMHGHGFATLALSQAWTMSVKSDRGARIERALRAAVRCIERSQGVDGGWYYEPRASIEHENSITITVVQALRGARDAGIDVDQSVITRALEYVRSTQQKDGAFRYARGDERHSLALTAASVATLQAVGRYSGQDIGNGFDWLMRRIAAREPAGLPVGDTDLVLCSWYERLYVSEALWEHTDPTPFEDWWRREFPRLVTLQRADGAFVAASSAASDARFGEVYSTAMSCLVLAIPEGVLPIFQR